MAIPPLRRALGLIFMLILEGCAAVPEVGCDLRMVMQVPLQIRGSLPVVPAGINGKWASLVVDTGAEQTMITSMAADRLGLLYKTPYTGRSMGIGGSADIKAVTVDPLVLGGVRFPIGRISVGNFKFQNAEVSTVDGVLGVDILLAFDLDLDLPGGKLTLYHSSVCPDTQPPWQEPWLEIPRVQALRNRLLAPFELDNVPGLGILDTGAAASALGVDMARRIGLSEHAMAADPIVRPTGIGSAMVEAHLHRFDRLRIGPLVGQQPQITVLSSDFGIGDAVIGQDFLRGRRLWMSLRNRRIFVSRRSNEQ